MKNRDNSGKFVFAGGKESERRDKPCPDCGKIIMRKSTRCRSCSQKGSLGGGWRGGIEPCTQCGKIRKFHSESPLCRDCFKEENHFNWKGEEAGYVSLHTWVRSRLGTPSVCFICGTRDANRYEWANISGEYHRDLEDWMRLCKSCHVRYDKINHSLYKEKYGK